MFLVPIVPGDHGSDAMLWDGPLNKRLSMRWFLNVAKFETFVMAGDLLGYHYWRPGEMQRPLASSGRSLGVVLNLSSPS